MIDNDPVEREVAELVVQALSHALISPLNTIERKLCRINKPNLSSDHSGEYDEKKDNIIKTTGAASKLITRKRNSIRHRLNTNHVFERKKFLASIDYLLNDYVRDVELTTKEFSDFSIRVFDNTRDLNLIRQISTSAQHFREIYRGIHRFVAYGGPAINTSCNISNQLALCFTLIEAKDHFEGLEVFNNGKVEFDQILLRTMFIEIMTNSIKYSRPDIKPQLRIYIEQPWTAEDQSNSRLYNPCKITFTDNGIGIKRDELDSVMTLGFRSPSIKNQIVGSGSGLAMCKFFVERSGGKIWITSEPSQGTTVHLVLPGSTIKATKSRASDPTDTAIFSEPANTSPK